MGLADIENPFRQFPSFSDSRGRKISEDGVLDRLLYDAGPVKGKGGIWKATMPEDRSDYNREDERVTRRERLIDRAPARLQIKFKPSGELKKLLERLDLSTEAIPDIDWNKTFDEAGLDPGQRQVVNNM